VIDEPGAPAWFELHTRAYGPSLDFYRAVFGWSTRTESDSDDFRYTTLTGGSEQRAGILDATTGQDDDEPAAWSLYFDVSDVDRSLAQLEELGGSILQPAADTPYRRLARAADPTGTPFRLIEHT